MIINIKTKKVNDVVDKKLKFDSRNSIANNRVQDPLTIVTIRLRGGKN